MLWRYISGNVNSYYLGTYSFCQIFCYKSCVIYIERFALFGKDLSISQAQSLDLSQIKGIVISHRSYLKGYKCLTVKFIYRVEHKIIRPFINDTGPSAEFTLVRNTENDTKTNP